MARSTKILVAVLSGFALMASVLPSAVLAKGPANVSATIHNFSTAGKASDGSDSQYRSQHSEVCVFCHTPHGGSLTGPLWNRPNPTTTWTHYDSQTLGSYLGGLAQNRAISDESLMCMSCHDGSIYVNHLLNVPNVDPAKITGAGGSDIEIIGFPALTRIGAGPSDPFGTGDLSDDHPISFSYDDVLLSSEYQAGGAKDGQLRPVAFAESPTFSPGEGVRFFNKPMAGLGGNRVECSTCHDPHVEYDMGNPDYMPFLIMKNTGSNLCLACHNK